MNIYEQQAANRRMTVFMMAVFVGFFLLLGFGFDYFYFGYRPLGGDEVRWNAAGYYEPVRSGTGLPIATVISLLIGGGMALNGMVNGSRMVLRSTMARRVEPGGTENERRLLNVVAEMATAAGLPAPAVYVVPDADLNAFATGMSPSSSAIAVTQGLLEKLNREELQGVVAHEMSHIRNLDIRLMTLSAALTGAIALLSDFAGRSMRYGRSSGGSYGGSSSSSSGSSRRGGGGAGALVFFALWLVLIILAPLLSRMLAMAISRQREYLADAGGAELTRNPAALIAALEKITAAVEPTKAINNGVAHMCITDPRGSLIEEKAGFAADLLATHPPMAKRILALKVMAYQGGRTAAV